MKQTPTHHTPTSLQDELDLNVRMSVPDSAELAARISSTAQTLPQIKASAPSLGRPSSFWVRLLGLLTQPSVKVISTLASAGVLVILLFNVSPPSAVVDPSLVSEVVTDEQLETVSPELQISDDIDELLTEEALIEEALIEEALIEEALIEETGAEFVWDQLMLMQDELLFAQI